jgi:hypothetical protein
LVIKTLKGAKKTTGAPRCQENTPLPRAIRSSGPTSSHDDRLFIAILTAGFHGFLRLGELGWPDCRDLRDYRKVTLRLIQFLPSAYSFFLPGHEADRFFEGNRVLIMKTRTPDTPFPHSKRTSIHATVSGHTIPNCGFARMDLFPHEDGSFVASKPYYRLTSQATLYAQEELPRSPRLISPSTSFKRLSGGRPMRFNHTFDITPLSLLPLLIFLCDSLPIFYIFYSYLPSHPISPLIYSTLRCTRHTMFFPCLLFPYVSRLMYS